MHTHKQTLLSLIPSLSLTHSILSLILSHSHTHTEEAVAPAEDVRGDVVRARGDGVAVADGGQTHVRFYKLDLSSF